MKHAGSAMALMFLLVSQGTAQTAKTAYPKMAPVAQYLMSRDTEIAIARSAAPKSVSDAAEIMVFTPNGFQTAVKGTNGFVCLVARSWSAGFDDPDFWDPQVRAPICYNAPAARSQVPATNKRTQVALAGGSSDQILKAITDASSSGELPRADPESMSYMLSRQTYLDHRIGHWLPHLMFYTADVEPKLWGAGSPESPIIGNKFPEEHLTIFLIPVARWSDGTMSDSSEH